MDFSNKDKMVFCIFFAFKFVLLRVVLWFDNCVLNEIVGTYTKTRSCTNSTSLHFTALQAFVFTLMLCGISLYSCTCCQKLLGHLMSGLCLPSIFDCDFSQELCPTHH